VLIRSPRAIRRPLGAGGAICRPLGAGLAIAVLLSACGSDDDDASGVATTTPASVVEDVDLVPGASTTTTTTPPDMPVVSIPADIPTELVVTDLVVGTGPAAAEGDTVVVDYVGVRSEDGEQFDASYGREPFDVTLGAGEVIPGWEQGLVGVQVGGRRQLDIPNDLAYGDQARGDVIRAGDALTFVVDVRAVIHAASAEDAPTDIEAPTSEGATATTTTDVVVGDGAELAAGDTGIVRLLVYRGDNGALLYNSWEQGEPLRAQLVEGSTLPGLVTGLEGMRVGGRRIITMPPADAFGEEGNPDIGLPANTDVVIVAELLATL
jgi:FKBP-type peptidyl-prolyl cis-trans isomerase